MPFSSDPSNSLTISLAASLTKVWALVCLCSARIAQDTLQSFAQADGFQGDNLAPAFGIGFDSERLQALGDRVAQGDFSGWIAIALPLP